MRREVTIATAWGLGLTLLLALLIVVGSRNLAHFDAALVAYTFAVLFATFGLTYRYAMWLQRPPTAVYWRRGWHRPAGGPLPEPCLELHPRLAETLGVADGDWVTAESRRGTCTLRASVVTTIRPDSR